MPWALQAGVGCCVAFLCVGLHGVWFGVLDCSYSSFVLPAHLAYSWALMRLYLYMDDFKAKVYTILAAWTLWFLDDLVLSFRAEDSRFTHTGRRFDKKRHLSPQTPDIS